MSTKTQHIIGWILTALVGLFMIGASGMGKFIDYPGKEEQMAKLQMPVPLLATVAIIEIAVTVAYLIPRTAVLGAILMSAYLGGAVWTHLRIGESWLFPVIVGVLGWTGLVLRRPALLPLVLGHRSPAGEAKPAASVHGVSTVGT